MEGEQSFYLENKYESHELNLRIMSLLGLNVFYPLLLYNLMFVGI